MPTSNETLKERLARYREIKITVIGRKSGKKISVPVWFVFEEEKSKEDKSKKKINQKKERSACCPCRARTRSGTRTCCTIRRFGSMRAAQKQNSELLP